MASPFSRTLRSLDAEGSRKPVLAIAVAAVLGIAWLTWFVEARLELRAESEQARLEVAAEPHPVQARAAGTVSEVLVRLGQSVTRNQVLLRLDARELELALAETRTRIDGLRAQLPVLRAEIDAAQNARLLGRQVLHGALNEAEERTLAARALANSAESEAARLEVLLQGGAVAAREQERAASQASERRAEARAQELSKLRRRFEELRAQSEQAARIEGLRRELVELEATVSELHAGADRVAHSIELRTLIAPIDGTVGELAPVTVGSIVEAGQQIATVIPNAVVRAVAQYVPAVALGRVRVGQRAQIKLVGFPWEQYGSLNGVVTAVASEPHGQQGRVRVEIALSQGSNPRLPIEHGLPAEVDVHVEETSPLELVLRSIGAMRRAPAQRRAPGGRSP